MALYGMGVEGLMSTDSNTSSSSSGGIGFCGLLTILFIGLKLTHYINWSWWWVLSPILIPTGIVLIILLVGGIILLAAVIQDSRKK